MSGSFFIAKGMNLNCTPRKLSLVTDLIKGRNVEEALKILTFCNKKAAFVVKKVLQSAIFNAQNNFNVDIDLLSIKEILVGKSEVSFYRMSPRARGKGCKIRKRRGNVVVKLSKGD